MSTQTPSFNAIKSMVLFVVFSCALTALVQILALLLFVGLCAGVLFFCGIAITYVTRKALTHLSPLRTKKGTVGEMPVSENTAEQTELQPENKTVVASAPVETEESLDSPRTQLESDVPTKPTEVEVASIKSPGLVDDKEVARLRFPTSPDARLTMCVCERYPLLPREFVPGQLRLEREELGECSSKGELLAATAAVAVPLDSMPTPEGISILESSLDLATETEIQTSLTIRQMRNYAAANQLENHSRCKNKADYARFFVQHKMSRSQLLDAMAMPKRS